MVTDNRSSRRARSSRQAPDIQGTSNPPLTSYEAAPHGRRQALRDRPRHYLRYNPYEDLRGPLGPRTPLPQVHPAGAPACKGCDLYLHATQPVPGTGAAHAPLLLVGEQPGDQEDLQGLPFVGPAGRVLNRAYAELSIDPSTIYVTNAVKHFKFTPRGKFRLHQTPRMSEVTACRPWLLAEIQTIRPRVILCLGATAAKSLLGSTFSLTQSRGRILSTPFADKVMATYHPSAILRAQDAEGGADLFHFLKLDLQLAHETALAA